MSAPPRQWSCGLRVRRETGFWVRCDLRVLAAHAGCGQRAERKSAADAGIFVFEPWEANWQTSVMFPRPRITSAVVQGAIAHD